MTFAKVSASGIAASIFVALTFMSGSGTRQDEIANAAQVVQTPPPDRAAPSPTPQPLSFNGQVIDLERGYVVFSTGDALKVAAELHIVDAATNLQPAYQLTPGFFAIAALDPKSGEVVGLRTSQKPLAGGTAVTQIPRRFVVAVSSPRPNPDLIPKRAVFTSVLSKAVTVTILVSVPPDTPFNDSVYVATDTSGWNAQAIKMQRVDGLHFRILIDLAGGTEIHYLFTRGSWQTVERDRSGLQRKPRNLFVPGGDSQIIDATIYRWGDLP